MTLTLFHLNFCGGGGRDSSVGGGWKSEAQRAPIRFIASNQLKRQSHLWQKHSQKIWLFAPGENSAYGTQNRWAHFTHMHTCYCNISMSRPWGWGAAVGGTAKKNWVSPSMKLNGKSGGEQRVTFHSRKMPAKEESLMAKKQKIYKMLDFNKCFN